MDIGQRIRGLRGVLKLSQSALAGRLGVPQSYISDVETSGEKSEGISVRQVRRFAGALEVRPIVLIEQGEYEIIVQEKKPE